MITAHDGKPPETTCVLLAVHFPLTGENCALPSCPQHLPSGQMDRGNWEHPPGEMLGQESPPEEG